MISRRVDNIEMCGNLVFLVTGKINMFKVEQNVRTILTEYEIILLKKNA